MHPLSIDGEIIHATIVNILFPFHSLFVVVSIVVLQIQPYSLLLVSIYLILLPFSSIIFHAEVAYFLQRLTLLAVSAAVIVKRLVLRSKVFLLLMCVSQQQHTKTLTVEKTHVNTLRPLTNQITQITTAFYTT